MANNSVGLPYPLPTDPIAGGADAIKALADGIPVYAPMLGANSSAAWTTPGGWAQITTALPVAQQIRKVTYAPGQATIQIPGLYLVGASLRLAAVGTLCAVQVTLNQAAVDTGVIVYDYRPNAQLAIDRKLVRLAAGDILRIFGYGAGQAIHATLGATLDLVFVGS